MPSSHQHAYKLGTQRPNIGLLGSPMHSEQGFWVGVAEAAEAYEVNLFAFLGGAVMTRELLAPTRLGLIGIESAAVLYDLIDVERMDGLITWAGAGAGLGTHLSQDEMDAFFRQYRALPIVNYEKVVAGIPTVLTDTAQGMRELLIHMIETHGSRRIALLRGLHNHFESNERHRAYDETLAEYGLPLNTDLVCTATGWGLSEGAHMVRTLLNERGLRAGLDFDTVVGTEGQYIVGAVRELQAQGIQVPNDVIVAGYNDMTEARASSPSITIMRKPFYESGWKTLEILLELLHGKPVPAQTLVPSELIIRRSCGCWPQVVHQLALQTLLFSPQNEKPAALATSESLEALFAEHQDEILAALTRSLGFMFPPESADEQAKKLLNALFADITNESESSNIFISAVEAALKATPGKVEDLESWESVLSTLRSYTSSYLVDSPDKWFRVETLWQQARVIVQLEVRRLEQNDILENLLLALNLRETNWRFMAVFDMAELLDAIAQELPKLGIPAFYIALYEKPQPFMYPQIVPEWSQLVLAVDERGRVNLPPQGQLFRSRHLLPDDLSLPDRAASRIVVPLYVGQQQFGFALLETGPKKGTLYTELWQLISNALHVVFLMKERLELALERERVALLKDFIRDVGHEIRTPLSIINTSVYLLNKQLDSENRVRHLELLKKQSTHIQTLVEATLTMSKLDSGDEFAFALLYVTDLLRELETTMRSLADEKQVTFTAEIADDLPCIQGDREELFRALSYIVKNAIQYTPTGGKVTIWAYASPDSIITEVADTGIGIHEADLSRIFERFYRVDQARTARGAGLGLSIAKKIIEVHQGSIEVVSTPDKGSIFKIVLPHNLR